MTNFEQFSNIMNQYLEGRGYTVQLETNISKLSQSTEEETPLCRSKLKAINMDAFAKKAYRKIILPDSKTEDDAINTADAFLINRDNEWYFIEFKDARLGNAKASVLKKAYSNVYAVLDVLYTMQRTKVRYDGFDYENPVEFMRHNVTYVLVFSSAKNPQHVIQLKNHQLKGEKYLPVFMERLPGYIYKDAYAMTEINFDGEFARQITY